MYCPPRSWRGNRDSLYGTLGELSARKDLLRANINLFYPLSMADSDDIRGLLEGHGALLGDDVLRRFRRENVPVSSINTTGQARLESMLAHWQREPETVRRSGSAATGLVHAIIRLDALYRDFFAPPPPAPPVPVRPADVIGFEELDG